MTGDANRSPCAAGRWDDLADRVLQGEAVPRDAALEILEADDLDVPALLAAAFRVRFRHFGRKVHLYQLQNAKSGLCPEDCGYCSQSVLSTADIPRYSLLSEQKLLDGAAQAVANRSRTFCIVTSGRGPSHREVDRLAQTVRTIKDRYGLHICCCLGLLEPEQAATLKAAGVDRINHNLNTSRAFHDRICSTHGYDDRLRTLRTVREAGMELCSGMIVGMGESPADIVEVACELRDLRVESIPINFLNPIDGTPLEGTRTLDPRFCLKVLCLFRFLHPDVEIRIAGGREVNLRSLQPLGLYPANSLFVSDYLTTKGQAPSDDFRLIEDLGFEIVVGDHLPPDATAAPDPTHAAAAT